MGPTGAPTEIPRNETVLLAGGGLGNAVLFSIAKALKDAGCKVVYFAGYKKKDDVFKRDEIEAGTDQVIWSVDAGEPIAPRRAAGPRLHRQHRAVDARLRARTRRRSICRASRASSPSAPTA